MSYNTRRGRGGSLNQNFVSGGQFQSAVKPGVQMNRPMQSQNQYNQAANKPVYQTSLPPAPLKSALKTTTNQNYQSQLKQEPKTPQKPQVTPQVVQPVQPVVQPQPPQQPAPQQQIPVAQPQELKEEMMDTENIPENPDEATNGGKKKLPWKHVKSGKISKKEKRGRRNQRLRKILQPKNALMVLNEIVGGQKYSVSEAPVSGDESFVATVTVEGQDFIGNGKSKSAAKTSAAENALKNILLNKLRTVRSSSSASLLPPAAEPSETDGDVPMADSESEKQQDEDDVSWLHVASYAIHKLFDSWDADGILNDSVTSLDAKNLIAGVTIGKPVTKKPAKALPSNAELMNPVMLLNQMRPGVVYEDFHKEGTSPNIQFTIRASIDGLEFFGKGTNKKLARKNCALEACKKLFDITYPPEEVA